MLTVRGAEADSRTRAASLWLQLLMCKCRFPVIDDSMDSRRFCKSRGRRGVRPSGGSKADDTREMRFMVVEIRLQSLYNQTLFSCGSNLPTNLSKTRHVYLSFLGIVGNHTHQFLILQTRTNSSLSRRCINLCPQRFRDAHHNSFFAN